MKVNYFNKSRVKKKSQYSFQKKGFIHLDRPLCCNVIVNLGCNTDRKSERWHSQHSYASKLHKAYILKYSADRKFVEPLQLSVSLS